MVKIKIDPGVEYEIFIDDVLYRQFKPRTIDEAIEMTALAIESIESEEKDIQIISNLGMEARYLQERFGGTLVWLTSKQK